MLGLSMPRTQTLNHKYKNKGKETKIYKIRQDAYVPGAEERDLLIIYTRYKRITIGSIKNSHQKSTIPLNPKNELHPLFIERRRNPQKTVPDRVRISSDPTIGRPTQVCG